MTAFIRPGTLKYVSIGCIVVATCSKSDKNIDAKLWASRTDDAMVKPLASAAAMLAEDCSEIARATAEFRLPYADCIPAK